MLAVCQSTCAGYWYPAGASELRDLLTAQFKLAREHDQSPESGSDTAFIVPHAAPAYSGKVAAAAYLRASEANPRRVLLLGFYHSGGCAGVMIPPVEAYRTPLGETTLDLQAIDTLRTNEGFGYAAASDHSVEVQLPFLQFVMPQARLVPLFVGPLDAARTEAAATALSDLLADDTVLIASSDFTHYGRSFGFVPFPLDSETPRRIREQDLAIIQAIGTLDAGEYQRLRRRSPSSLCGDHPVSLLVETLRRFRTRVAHRLLSYAQSGEMTGDYRQSVSYAAVAFSSMPEPRAGLADIEIGLA